MRQKWETDLLIRNIEKPFIYGSFSIFSVCDPVEIAYPRRLAPAILQNLKRLQRVKSKLFSLKPLIFRDPVGIQTQDLQNRKQTLKSPKTPLFIGLSRICHFHFAAILRLSQTGTWFICLFLF